MPYLRTNWRAGAACFRDAPTPGAVHESRNCDVRPWTSDSAEGRRWDAPASRSRERDGHSAPDDLLCQDVNHKILRLSSRAIPISIVPAGIRGQGAGIRMPPKAHLGGRGWHLGSSDLTGMPIATHRTTTGRQTHRRLRVSGSFWRRSGALPRCEHPGTRPALREPRD